MFCVSPPLPLGLEIEDGGCEVPCLNRFPQRCLCGIQIGFFDGNQGFLDIIVIVDVPLQRSEVDVEFLCCIGETSTFFLQCADHFPFVQYLGFAATVP